MVEKETFLYKSAQGKVEGLSQSLYTLCAAFCPFIYLERITLVVVLMPQKVGSHDSAHRQDEQRHFFFSEIILQKFAVWCLLRDPSF